MNKISRVALFLWLMVQLLVAGQGVVRAQDGLDAEPVVAYIQAEGPLTPAMLGYVERGVQIAQDWNATALIFRLDTPGGELGLMQDIVQAVRQSDVPVVVYVAPRGAAAWSAGALITLAGHAAAMAPETGIGASSPVSGTDAELSDTAERKAKESVRALARDLAAPRGEEAVEWAEAAVEEAVAASASEALEIGIVDFIAEDLETLLAKLDGFEVQVNGESVTLRTAGAPVQDISMSLIEQILHVVVNPTIVFTLLAIGVQALLIEISNPGGWVAGFIGIVSIALAVYGLGVLPVNGLGLVLIALSIGLFVLEVKAVTHGALTVAGVITMVAGALILFNSGTGAQWARISIPVVIAVALSFAGTFLFIVTKALQAQRTRPKTGVEGLIGEVAEVRIDLDPEGTVFLEGERWNAVAEEGPISRGETVEVVGVDGFRLQVRRVNSA